MSDETREDRREFLASAARLCAATGLCGAGAWLALRPRGNPDCAKPVACGGCAVFIRCDLPKAELARRMRAAANSAPAGAGEHA